MQARTQEQLEHGVVQWFNEGKGYGFIRPQGVTEAGSDVFVHFTGIRQIGKGRRNLAEGQQVEYKIGRSDKGQQAEDVIVVG
jgi:CspA family cold shock protein